MSDAALPIALQALWLGAGASTNLSAFQTKQAALPLLPSKLEGRRVMASPPTVTLSSSATLSSYRDFPAVGYNTAQSTLAKMGGTEFTFTKAAGFAKKGTSFPDYTYINAGYIDDGSTIGAEVYSVSSMHYGPEIEFYFKGDAKYTFIKINDEYVSLTPTTFDNTGAANYVHIDFGSSEMRRIELLTNNATFGGARIGQTDTLTPATIRGPRCIFLGDSFTQGVAATYRALNHTQMVADMLGWDDVWPSGIGSAGYYVNVLPKPYAIDRLPTEVEPYEPDVVWFALGINDSQQGYANVLAQARACFNRVRTNLPNALPVVNAPYNRIGAISQHTLFYDTYRAIKLAASEYDAVFIDFIEMPLPTGYTPQAGTMLANAGGTTIRVDFTPILNATYRFGDNNEKFVCKAITRLGDNNYQITLDGGLLNTHLAGTTVTQVGDSLWTGTGKVGTTTGWGNCDLLVSSDGTHPSQLGHDIIGMTEARLFVDAMYQRASLFTR